MTRVPRTVTAALLGPVLLLTAGCSLFGDDEKEEDLAVAKIAVGDCFRVPEEPTVEITSLTQVGCDSPHEQEAYALPTYVPEGVAATATATSDGSDDPFPGAAAIKVFADGACAEEFVGYVDVDYRDSALWFTYLSPSARSWETGDRTVACFVTTTGGTLTQSVRGTGW